MSAEQEPWYREWVQFPGGGDSGTLHRAGAVAWDGPGAWEHGHGSALCGRTGVVVVPGILSRLGAPRCPACCAAAGVNVYFGHPRNERAPAPNHEHGGEG